MLPILNGFRHVIPETDWKHSAMAEGTETDDRSIDSLSCMWLRTREFIEGCLQLETWLGP